MDSESGLPDIKIIIGLALALSIGLLLNILACVIWNNWWPILVVIAYFFAPMPNLIFQRCGSDPLDVSGRSFKDLGFFLTGFLVVTGFGIPAVMAHSEVIEIGALILALCGGLVVYASILVYLHFFHKKPDF